jgi:hydrogenase nickel incorporation protein HypA/HybF
MHEYSLVQAMFDQIGEVVRSRGALSVRRVRVRIGEFAGVDPTLFQTAYEIFRVNTWCAGAPLEIERAGTTDELLLEQVELEVP